MDEGDYHLVRQKKVYGGNARYYAPGQVKKRVYYYEYDDNRGHKYKEHKRHHRD